jgi:hypothetical protein
MLFTLYLQIHDNIQIKLYLSLKCLSTLHRHVLCRLASAEFIFAKRRRALNLKMRLIRDCFQSVVAVLLLETFIVILGLAGMLVETLLCLHKCTPQSLRVSRVRTKRPTWETTMNNE